MFDINVSIIIPTIDSIDTLPRLVNALLKQLNHSHHELIFLDSESSDGTLEYISQIPFPHVSVHKIRRSEFSHSQTRMFGAELAWGEVVVFCSDDIVLIGDESLDALCRPVLDGCAVASFGVSLIPSDTADPLRANRYNDWFKERPELILPLSRSDWERLSPERRFFYCRFDDCFACYRKKKLLEVRFPNVAYGEDIAIAKEFLLSDNIIALAKKARFYHWHCITFRYQLQRMCIDQLLVKELFDLEFIPSVFHLFILTCTQFCLYTCLGCFLPGIKIKKRVYWIWYSYRYIVGDNLGKYLGCMDTEKNPRWNILKHWFAKVRRVVCEEALDNNLKRVSPAYKDSKTGVN